MEKEMKNAVTNDDVNLQTEISYDYLLSSLSQTLQGTTSFKQYSPFL
jgi:hypothetical protein